jgi:hypothetical protein
LLKAGANPKARDSQGTFPLFMAVHQRDKRAVKLLLDHKADPNQKNAYGVSALMYTTNPTNVAKRMGWSISTTPSDLKTLSEMTELLRQYGANENLSRLNAIGFVRDLDDLPWQYFTQDSEGRNRHSLLELIASVYQGRGPTENANNISSARGRQRDGQTPQAIPHFPDFGKVRIDRLINNGKDRKQITVDVEEILRSGDCTTDVWLEWGDVVELPEEDHRIDQNWAGLPDEFAQVLRKCLQRNVTIRVKGQVHSIQLSPGLTVRTTPSRRAAPESEIRTTLGFFRLSNVVYASKILHASSDLRNVKVVRRDPQTGKSQEMRFNIEKADPATDLWLRDGDVIEIPEKT